MSSLQPATRANLDDGSQLRHRDCEAGLVICDGWLLMWTCTNCGRQWRDSRMRGYSDQELADRFEALPKYDPCSHVLVWKKNDRGYRYAALVRADEAQGLDRVQF